MTVSNVISNRCKTIRKKGVKKKKRNYVSIQRTKREENRRETDETLQSLSPK